MIKQNVVLWVWVLVVAAVCISPGHTVAADQEVIFERWYELSLMGEPAGKMHMRQTQAGDQVTTIEKADVVMKRGGIELQITMTTQSIETTDGKPIEIKSSVNSGALMSMSKTMRFADDQIEIVNDMAGQQTVQNVPMPQQQFMMPYNADLFVKAKLSEGETEFRHYVMNPEFGFQPIEKIYNVQGRQQVSVMGKPMDVLAVQTTLMAGGAQTGTEYLDRHYRTVKGVLAAGGLQMSFEAVGDEVAGRQYDAPELKNTMWVKIDQSIPDPRSLRQGIYLLEIQPVKREPGQPLSPKMVRPTLPVAGYQKGNWNSHAKARVTVDLDKPIRTPHDMPAEVYRKPSIMLNSDDPALKKLASEAIASLPADASSHAKAEAMRKFVNHYIEEKNLSVGLASATEVAQTRVGDCTEHAVLLAALLRCENIPSRTVTGLVYVDRFLNEPDVFVYHMWTQAWLADDGSPDGRIGKWVDYDATMQGVAFDAAHIALGVSSMADDAVLLDQAELAALIGRLKIKVLKQ